ncbi:magnesium chelatase subunit D family protein [Desertivirga brevis]|uniref:magnesium chelatase subunit D family protein n=1 Tax=Desertivirga brevis TaxID=2810310 RepID=UPI001A977254|nr:magnesium chelatase subunit D family protein [Pedobacter sp. SYSU D00873]
MIYPFTAIVGQEKLKKALLLCAINPSIGGVLIRGDKGTAKSTAARALAKIVPPISRTVGCRFNCPDHAPLSICEACMQIEKELELVQVPFVNLPLGASEERVLGQLDLEGILIEKKKKLQPGLLASAHQGILYIDEVNLLSDHLVDVLLDAAAMGVNTIEREGLSVSHPSRFTLIGTMNIEEGNLRPQLLDRFGLMVDVEAPASIEERTEVVRRRVAYESDPASFIARWREEQETLRSQLITAKELLPQVQLGDDLLTLISELSMGMGVKSLRADIVMYKTAQTIAALEGRPEVTAEDIREAAELVLAHRSHQKPFSDPGFNKDKLDDMISKSQSKPDKGEEDEQSFDNEPEGPVNSNPARDDNPISEKTFAANQPHSVPHIELKINTKLDELQEGKRSLVDRAKKGKYTRAESLGTLRDIAIDSSVYHAIQRDPENFELRKEDIQQKVRNGKTGNLILFVVDASGSMAANKRMEAVKGTVLNLLKDAYQRRDEVTVIAFRGIEAKVLLQPTRSVELAEVALNRLPTGGRTPLPHALQTAFQLARMAGATEGLKPILVILSDGKANVPVAGGDPWEETLNIAASIKSEEIPGLVINTDVDYLQLGKAQQMAQALGLEYISLADIDSDQLTPVVKKVL